MKVRWKMGVGRKLSEYWKESICQGKHNRRNIMEEYHFQVVLQDQDGYQVVHSTAIYNNFFKWSNTRLDGICIKLKRPPHLHTDMAYSSQQNWQKAEGMPKRIHIRLQTLPHVQHDGALWGISQTEDRTAYWNKICIK